MTEPDVSVPAVMRNYHEVLRNDLAKVLTPLAERGDLAGFRERVAGLHSRDCGARRDGRRRAGRRRRQRGDARFPFQRRRRRGNVQGDRKSVV